MINDAVITLMQRFPQSVLQSVSTSQWSHTSAVALWPTLLPRATGNSALEGWAFELQQLEILKKGIQFPPAASDSGLAFLPTDEAHFDGGILVGDIDAHRITIIWCLEWNQGCFRVAVYCKGTLVTFQFTVSTSHSLKLEDVKDLRPELLGRGELVKTVAHIGINKDGQLKWTRVGGARGSSCQVDFTNQLSESSSLKVSSAPYNTGRVLATLNAATVEMHSNKRKVSG